jgi:tetraacyldisaccharide 4'-kinase
MQPLGNGIFPRALSALYGTTVTARNFLFDHIAALSHDAGRPVVSVGGVNAGGTGKTPLALLVGTYLQHNGNEVVFLSRGYRRKSSKTVICAPQSVAGWENVGDEPALLHANLPGSWLGIGADRHATVRRMAPALSKNAVFVLDDGFQHRRLRRNIDIICVPADVLDDSLLPAGTLREPLVAMKRAHSICVIGSPGQNALLKRTREEIYTRYKNRMVTVLHQVPAGWVHVPSGEVHKELPLKKPILLCGIARPQRFTRLVRSMGVSPARELVCADHHEFTASQISDLCLDASGGAHGAAFDGILTTEKDAHRLHTLNLVNCPDIWYLKIDLQFSDQDSKSVFFSHLSAAISP